MTDPNNTTQTSDVIHSMDEFYRRYFPALLESASNIGLDATEGGRRLAASSKELLAQLLSSADEQ